MSVVRARDAHGAGLGPQPGRERLAQGEDAPADALLALEDDRLVAGAPQLEAATSPAMPAPITATRAGRSVRGPRPSVRTRSGSGPRWVGAVTVAADQRPLADDEQLVAGGEHGVVGRVHLARAVDEHADEQGVVPVLEHLERVAGALVHQLGRQRDPVQLLALGMGEQVGDHAREPVGARRRRRAARR